MPKITFADDTRHLLLSYGWPGNVRQLKNVIEQLALFEAGNEISYKILNHYLPKDSVAYTDAPMMQPAVRTNSYDREREMLFNLIFRLQNELSDLRKEIDDIKATNQEAPSFNIEAQIHTPISTALTKASHHNSNIIDIDAVDDALVHDTPDTLEETEKETIRKSLLRNDGRRKITAQELNISERTLYRKIKEYGLD